MQPEATLRLAKRLRCLKVLHMYILSEIDLATMTIATIKYDLNFFPLKGKCGGCVTCSTYDYVGNYNGKLLVSVTCEIS